MSFSIRKIGMLEMPKIAMLSTNCDAVYIYRKGCFPVGEDDTKEQVA